MDKRSEQPPNVGGRQETLAEIVGTRSRVSLFMNKFRRLGFIEYDGDIKVRSSLLDVVLYVSLSRSSLRRGLAV